MQGVRGGVEGLVQKLPQGLEHPPELLLVGVGRLVFQAGLEIPIEIPEDSDNRLGSISRYISSIKRPRAAGQDNQLCLSARPNSAIQ